MGSAVLQANQKDLAEGGGGARRDKQGERDAPFVCWAPWGKALEDRDEDRIKSVQWERPPSPQCNTTLGFPRILGPGLAGSHDA